MKKIAFAFTVLVGFSGISGAAHACSSGFIADALCQAGIIDQNTANTLDGINAQGKFVERGVATVLDTYVAPGAGGAYLMTQGIGGGPQIGGQTSSVPQGSHVPQVSQVLNTFPMPSPTLGNLCWTMSGYYPGPFTPVGMPCTAFTPFGVEGGVVVN